MASVIEVDDRTFEKEVVEAGIPVVVDFWAPWCGPCRMVGPLLDQLAESYDGRVKFTKLNTQNSPGVPSSFGIRSIPTVLLMDGPDVVDTIIGARPRDAFEKMVNRYLKKWEKRRKKEQKKAK